MEKKRHCILVTLTAPNVPGCDLKVEINKYNKAVDKLFKRQKYKHSIKGYLQKLEVIWKNIFQKIYGLTKLLRDV